MMNRTTRHRLLVSVAAAMVTAGAANVQSPQSTPRSSPIVVTIDGRRVVAVNPDSDSISVLDVQSSAITEIQTGSNPQTLALSSDGEVAFVANRGDDSVSVVSLRGGPHGPRIAACREPFGIVSHRTLLYVTCFGDSSVAVIDPASRSRIGTIDVDIDPRGLAVSPDGTKIYVTHFTSGRLSIIDVETSTVERVLETLADSSLSQSVMVDPASNLAYLPQTRLNSGNDALLFDTTAFPIVSVVDLSIPANVNAKRISIDVADRPSAIPIDAIRIGDRLFVVHAASNDVSVIDVTTGRSAAHLTVGANPRGATRSPDGLRLYVNNVLDGTISVLDTAGLRVIETIAVTSIPLPPRVLNGKKLFNTSSDPRIARDRWIACATCHFDGSMDRRTWFFRDGPRNTPTLRGVAGTGPFHWSGDLDELEDVEKTIREIQAGTGLVPGGANCEPTCDAAAPNGGRSADLDDLAAFTASLRRHPRSEAPSHETRRGRQIFFSPVTRCASCHRPPLFLDGLQHDVGTVTAARERKGPFIDTPTLIGVADTAPYFHDGSAPTLLDAIRRQSSDGKTHGHVSHLSEDELSALVGYINTVGVSETRRRAVRH